MSANKRVRKVLFVGRPNLLLGEVNRPFREPLDKETKPGVFYCSLAVIDLAA